MFTSNPRQALDFDIAIMTRGLYEEQASREKYELDQTQNPNSVDAEDVAEPVML